MTKKRLVSLMMSMGFILVALHNLGEKPSRFADLGYVYPGGITANTKTSLTALVTYLKVFVAVI